MASVLFYVQHLMGIGHLRRAALLTKAMQSAGLSVTLASGGFAVPELDIGGAELVQLPPARAADETFRVLLDEAGNAVDDSWRARRRTLLEELFDRVRPQVVLVEMFPFGRRQFRFELLPLLERAARREPRPWLVCSVRDILVEAPSPGRYEEMAGMVERFFDSVLVHGDPDFIPFERTFPLCGRIAAKLHHTGYVVAPPARSPPPGLPANEVLVSAGSRVGIPGGGEPLLSAAMAARELSSLAHLNWRLLAGLNFPEQQLRLLQAAAPAGVVIERFRPDFVQLLAGAVLCICQGGYNTTLEVLAAGVPAVIAPHGGDGEQVLRARLLAERGAVATLPAGEPPTPHSLAAAVARAMALPREPKPAAGGGNTAPAPIRMEGAREAAQIVAALAARPRRRS